MPLCLDRFGDGWRVEDCDGLMPSVGVCIVSGLSAKGGMWDVGCGILQQIVCKQQRLVVWSVFLFVGRVNQWTHFIEPRRTGKHVVHK